MTVHVKSNTESTNTLFSLIITNVLTFQKLVIVREAGNLTQIGELQRLHFMKDAQRDKTRHEN